ncbi:unnamed protein product [Cunninghamella blakesleeana]
MTNSVQDKTIEQKLAIARLAQVVLMENERKLGTNWTGPWWQKVMTYLQFTDKEKEMFSTLSAEAAISHLTTPKDIRIDVLINLLSVALNIDQKTLKEGHHPKEILYDARARQFLYLYTKSLALQPEELIQAERSLGQQLYFTLQEQTKKDNNQHHNTDEGRSSLMNDSAQKAMEDNNNKKKLYRWLATGAGVAVGGTIIALTGGLAAPLLAPILVGITGATFFGTAAGVVLVTSLFGLTGGGLTGMKVSRRMQGLSQFGFKQILVDKDIPPIPSLKCTICISGFLLEEESEATSTWINAMNNVKLADDTYCLEYESKILLDLGYAFRRFITNQALKYAGLEVAKQTALAAFFAAIALPAALLKVSDIIDDPWQLAVDRSKKAGIVLADTLEKRIQGNRPCDLIAYSCGCLVIWECLLELQKRKIYGAIDNVVLLGAPIPSDEYEDWNKALSVVSGRFVNAYTPDDWVLAYVYRLHSLETKVSGLGPVTVEGVENIPLDLEGHTSYPTSLKYILEKIKLI